MQKNDNILEVKNLKTYFPIKSGVLQRTVGHIKAVDDVSFSIKKDKLSGWWENPVAENHDREIHTSVGRAHGGSIIIDGVDISKLKSKELRSMRKKMQLIFQDPYSSLNPRLPWEKSSEKPCGSTTSETKTVRRITN